MIDYLLNPSCQNDKLFAFNRKIKINKNTRPFFCVFTKNFTLFSAFTSLGLNLSKRSRHPQKVYERYGLSYFLLIRTFTSLHC